MQHDEEQLDFFDRPSDYETAAGLSRILAGARTVERGSNGSVPSLYNGVVSVPVSATNSMRESLVNAAWGHWSWIDKIALPRSLTDDDVTRDSLSYIEAQRIEHRASDWYGRNMTGAHDTRGYTMALQKLAEGKYDEAITDLQFRGIIKEALATECAGVLTDVFLPAYETAIRSKDKVAGVRAALQYAALIHEFEERQARRDVADAPPNDSGEPQDSQEGSQEGNQEGNQDNSSPSDKPGNDEPRDDNPSDSNAGGQGKKLNDYLDDAAVAEIERSLAAVTQEGEGYDNNGHRRPAPVFNPDIYKVITPAQAENPLSETLRVKLDIEGKHQSISRLRQYGKVTKKVYRMRYGDVRVFAAPEHNQARVIVLVDNSSSTNSFRKADTMWDIVAAITSLFTDATVMTYHREGDKVVIGMVEVGNKLADRHGDNKILAVKGERIKSCGSTPDAEALLYVEQQAKTVNDVLLVHICDGGPDDPDETREVARQLYESGLRYATICIGYSGDDGVYPSEVMVRVENPMGDKDWQTIEGLLSYVIESKG